jgi:L-2-hydroxyglutarate oxidase LhgO
MANSIETDVVIGGRGVTGLFLSQMLSDKGVRVALVEKSAKLATGPSTSNEGWLHSGAYHAAAILDRRVAVQSLGE